MASVEAGARRRTLSSDRAADMEDAEAAEVRRREAEGQRRARPVSLVRTMSVNVDAGLAGEIFDHFCNAATLKSILRSFRYLCEVLRLKPNQLPFFYPKLKTNLKTWKAQALWTKLDKKAGHKCYNRGKACQGTRVLVIGAGPCGLRSAIEAQLLGAKVVVVEKRDRYSRNNVLHLWPCNIHELRGFGAKKFYGKFCAGSIDHVSIRQIQCILLKICLLLGVEVFEGTGYEDLIEPTDAETGWRAKVSPADHPVSQYEFDVMIGADGKRNTLTGFKRKEFRGKLAIAITANFINKHSHAEESVEEISGVAFIFNQKFFNDLNDELGIELENIVYYKDETHYFVMTAKKQSLLNKGVLITNHPDPSALLAPDNISQEALFQYAREAADFATKGQLPHLDFAVNHYGKPDVAMFDFTSMYAADHSARVVERHGHRLLQCLVGDSLLEPFWPTGTGCPRGFFSAMDAMWLMRQLESGKMSVLECLAERESIYRILSQTTPENINKDFSAHSLDPSTRYGQLNLKLVLPFQVTQCYDTDNPAHLQPQNVLQDSAPRKRRRKESNVNPGTLLTWLQTQVGGYGLVITDMTSSFQNGLAICAIIHRYRPDLIDFGSLDPTDIAVNNQLAFDILECELGISPITTGQEMAGAAEAGRLPDKLSMISYLTLVYELFRKEIPYTVQPDPIPEAGDDLDDSVYYHNHKAGREKKAKKKEREKGQSIGQLVASEVTQRKKRRSVENEAREEEAQDENRYSRVSNKKRLAKLMERAAMQEKKRKDTAEPKNIKNEERYKIIEQQFLGGGATKSNTESGPTTKQPGDLKRAIGRLDSADWNVKQIEEKLKNDSKKTENNTEKVPKWSKEAFNDKLAKVKSNLYSVEEDKKQRDIDASLAKLQAKLRDGTNGDGANKVSHLVGELSNKFTPSKAERPELKREGSNVWMPPPVKPGSKSSLSDSCFFCQKKVYVVERMSAEGKFFHRACFRCDYCNILLRLGSYVYHREGKFAGKFFCIPHSTANALEKYRFRNKTDEIAATETRRKELAKRREEKGPLSSLSPTNRSRLMEADMLARGATPERAEYEASIGINLSAEESGLEQIDEDEWTDRNFGNSTANDMNTSEDSVSDLESDNEDCEVGDEVERPLTADETRRLQREWRARYKGFGAGGSDCSDREGRDVRYTDQEYEDDTDEEEDSAITHVPFLPGSGSAKKSLPPKKRRRRARQRRRSSDASTSSDYTTSSVDSSSDESELRALDEKFNKENPFTVPEIRVQPNSPLPSSDAGAKAVTKAQPDSKYVSQQVPLGPAAYGTGLYQPSLSSMTKYQYKTPALSSQQPQAPATQYRTLSGVMSNNLKKNWASGSTAPASTQGQKKVDQAEIDARLKSLMDRLSNQQSMLKPAEKPSAQMQHYMSTSSSSGLRKLSDSKPLSPYKPLVTTQPQETPVVPETKVVVEENGVSLQVPELRIKEEELIDTEDSESDSETVDSDSVTTEIDEIENNVELQVPEIKINLAESEDLSPLETSEEKCDKTCDTQAGSESPHKEAANIQVKEEEETPSKERKPPVRRPSLLKTVVNIKHDQPVTVVNYTEQSSEDKTPVKIENPVSDQDDSFKTPQTDADITKENADSFISAMETSSSLAEDSLVTEVTGKSEEETMECLNDNVREDDDKIVDNGNEEDECGNLVIVDHNATPLREGERETSTDIVPENVDKSGIYDIYKITDSREKKEKLGQYNQHQSNMIHDLIIGKTKQRRARQPRVVAPTSSVPQVPPQDKSPEKEKSLQTFEDFQMIDEDDGVLNKTREKSLPRPFRENSMSRSLRESSVTRAMREGSPKITLPPTPITNPEKFGIRQAQEKPKSYTRGSVSSLISPTDSVASNDLDYNLDGLQSESSTPGPASPSKSSASLNNSPAHKKSKGFMAAVAGIFRTASPSPVTSPSHEAKTSKKEAGIGGRWSRKDGGGKSPENDLLVRTASLSLKASHPSTPPVPLSRKIKLGSQPPQASEDSFSDEEDVQDKSLSSIVRETSRSTVPKQILDRLEKRLTKSGKKLAKQSGSLRIRRAQELHRELEEVEVECVNVEERGVSLERLLRGQEAGASDLMGQWFALLREKNKLVRREQELMVEAKQLELEDGAEKLEAELATGPTGTRCGNILDSLVENAEQRELLRRMLDRDKERYRQEDREIEIKMAEQGIRL